MTPRSFLTVLALMAGMGSCARAPDPTANGPAAAGEVNLYSARHYDSDKALYAAFEEETGITVNVIEAQGPVLLERLKAEGANSPADVFLTVDVGNLHRAKAQNVFQPTQSTVLTDSVPAHLRDADGHWVAIAKRARVFVVNPALAPPERLSRYEDLADPQWRGQICVRSSNNVYNVSLLGALIEHWGAPAARDWAAGVVANFARAPQGGDTDQLRAVAAGACSIALVNHYYFARLIASTNAEDQAAAAKLQLIFPGQSGENAFGAHVNVTGAGLAAHAPNRDNAMRFLEFLVSPTAQTILAEGAFEYPASNGANVPETLLAFGDFSEDQLPIGAIGPRESEALAIFDAVGWP